MTDEAKDRLSDLGVSVHDNPTDAVRKRSGIAVAATGTTFFLNLAGESDTYQMEDEDVTAKDVMEIVASRA